jgi:hypothetical protein
VQVRAEADDVIKIVEVRRNNPLRRIFFIEVFDNKLYK